MVSTPSKTTPSAFPNIKSAMSFLRDFLTASERYFMPLYGLFTFCATKSRSFFSVGRWSIFLASSLSCGKKNSVSRGFGMLVTFCFARSSLFFASSMSHLLHVTNCMFPLAYKASFFFHILCDKSEGEGCDRYWQLPHWE